MLNFRTYLLITTIFDQIEYTTQTLLVLSPERLAKMFSDEIGISYEIQSDIKKRSGVGGVIDANYANFGFVPYGHSMVSKYI